MEPTTAWELGVQTLTDWDITRIEPDDDVITIRDELLRQSEGEIVLLGDIEEDAELLAQAFNTTSFDPPTVWCPGFGWEYL